VDFLAGTGKMGHDNKVLVGKMNGRDCLGDLSISGKIILKWI
jgi:hypothetical protein